MTMRMGLVVLAGCGLLSGCRSSSAVSENAPVAAGASRVMITVTDHGFVPDRIVVTRGTPVTLVFERRTEKSCLREVIVYTSEHTTIRRALPVGNPVAVTVTFDRSGELGYACGMGMYGGSIVVR